MFHIDSTKFIQKTPSKTILGIKFKMSNEFDVLRPSNAHQRLGCWFPNCRQFWVIFETMRRDLRLRKKFVFWNSFQDA